MTPTTGRATFHPFPGDARPNPHQDGKRARLITLLEQWDMLSDAGSGATGAGGTDNPPMLAHAATCRIRTTLRCTCWRRSLDELSRTLALLKLEQPVHHAHLVARHRDYTTVRRPVWCKKGHFQGLERYEIVVYPDLDRGHQPPTGWYDTVLHVWRPWVDSLIVIAALDRLEELYRGEVRLPTDNQKRPPVVELSAA